MLWLRQGLFSKHQVLKCAWVLSVLLISDICSDVVASALVSECWNRAELMWCFTVATLHINNSQLERSLPEIMYSVVRKLYVLGDLPTAVLMGKRGSSIVLFCFSSSYVIYTIGQSSFSDTKTTRSWFWLSLWEGNCRFWGQGLQKIRFVLQRVQSQHNVLIGNLALYKNPALLKKVLH